MEIQRPNDVLSRGEHEGFEWIVMANPLGFRCGYIKVPKGHPWAGVHGMKLADEIEVHGGVTFADNDHVSREVVTGDWWVGFDCGHAWDAPDPAMLSVGSSPYRPPMQGEVRTTEYVESECRSMCEQAASAVAIPS